MDMAAFGDVNVEFGGAGGENGCEPPAVGTANGGARRHRYLFLKDARIKLWTVFLFEVGGSPPHVNACVLFGQVTAVGERACFFFFFFFFFDWLPNR